MNKGSLGPTPHGAPSAECRGIPFSCPPPSSPQCRLLLALAIHSVAGLVHVLPPDGASAQRGGRAPRPLRMEQAAPAASPKVTPGGERPPWGHRRVLSARPVLLGHMPRDAWPCGRSLECAHTLGHLAGRSGVECPSGGVPRGSRVRGLSTPPHVGCARTRRPRATRTHPANAAHTEGACAWGPGHPQVYRTRVAHRGPRGQGPEWASAPRRPQPRPPCPPSTGLSGMPVACALTGRLLPARSPPAARASAGHSVPGW